ncbi:MULTISPECIES: hypothetical protein [unclassified Stygiolobus]|jgi:hypothetical protein|uniref:hypothetical protein n=1 Tax=unclassified Stygiolobus TaxID=2824672 RepID=UPI00307F0324
MGQFKNRSNRGKKHNGRSNGGRKKVKYVWVSSKKAIYLVTGEPRESKYSLGVPIIPLHGYYKSGKKLYTAKELSDYYVILNLPKDVDVDEWKGKRVVIQGYDQDALYIRVNETDKNESKVKGKKKRKYEDESEDRDEDESEDEDERDEGKDNESEDEDERDEDDDEEGEEE